MADKKMILESITEEQKVYLFLHLISNGNPTIHIINNRIKLLITSEDMKKIKVFLENSIV